MELKYFSQERLGTFFSCHINVSQTCYASQHGAQTETHVDLLLYSQ